MFRRAVPTAAVVALLSALLVACGGDEQAVDPDDLVIGVSGTEPGLAYVNADGSFSGFDVDLASYVAKKLGWSTRQVTFQMVEPDEREDALSSGEVDLVVSTYAITSEREQLVDFAGPYFIAGQDLLIPKDSAITGPDNLGSKTVCGLEGSDELTRLQEDYPSDSVAYRGAESYAECVDLLLEGEVGVVTADDAVLAGFAALHPQEIRVVGSPFSTDYYGVGLPKGSPDVAAVNAALQSAIDDGTWTESFERNLGASGYVAPLPPTPGVLPDVTTDVTTGVTAEG